MSTGEKWSFRLLVIGALAILGGLLGGDAPAAPWLVGLGAGSVLAGAGLSWAARSGRSVSPLAVRALLVVSLVAGVAVAVQRTASAPTADAAAQTPSSEATTTSSPAETTTSVTFPPEPTQDGWFTKELQQYDVEDHGEYGWGAIQPRSMRPIHLGTSSHPISAERRALLGKQLERARAAALKIGTVAGAKADGYQLVSKTPSDGRVEYVNFKYGEKLDLDHPQMMVFQEDKDDSPVIAIAYGVRGTYEAGPPTVFPLEIMPWHFHGPLCMDDDGRLIADMHTFEMDPTTYIDGKPASCEAHGGTLRTDLSAWMIDLWVVPGWENPWGLISSKHPDLYPKPWSG